MGIREKRGFESERDEKKKLYNENGPRSFQIVLLPPFFRFYF